MSKQLLNTVALLVVTAWSAAALAQEAPGRVGRIALTEGQVSVSAEGAQAATAQANWPVTSSEMITTARGARTELQIGSTFIRLDGDTSLEVLELDDDNLRLRLHYGSASIRIANPEVLAGFELSTPEGRVRMREPGRLRVDSGRIADTSSITVFDGAAQVEGGGASLTVRAGKRADLQFDDVRTVAATRDGFDDWALARDRAADAPTATRYVTAEMTGYNDLDRYGSWSMSPEYGPLWIPRAVAPGWAPYSDGSWVWMDQWGWTWVDNSPWGYAPFHYGRWVFANRHWGWAPGHREHRPVWSPALVGWVGGAGWNQGFRFNDRHQAMPARGWYPLSPHERFTPGYRISDEHLRRLNSDVRPDTRHRDNEHRGVTVVPQDQFGHRGQVVVPRVPHAVLPAQVLQTAPAATPPGPPPGARERDWRREERRGDQRPGERGDQRDHDRFERRGDERGQGLRPPVLSTEPAGPERRPPPQPVTVLSAPPVLPGQVAQQPRSVIPDRRPPPQPVTVLSAPPVLPGQAPQPPQPVIPEHRPPPQPVSVLSPPPILPGQQQVMPPQQQWRQEHRDRFEDERRDRHEFERRREAPAMQAPPAPPPMAVAQPAPVARQMQAPAPAQPQPQPQPQPGARPPTAAGQAPAHHGGQHPRDDGNARQQER
jgi:hypothetical protein